MTYDADTRVTAFEGARKIASGPLAFVARAIRTTAHSGFQVLIFADASGRSIDIDLRGEEAEVLDRLTPPAVKGPGRPKLGVTAREVTLLPRHWDWLADQPGGASVTLRKLVEEASRSPGAETKKAQAAAYQFMSAMAGNLPEYEEAIRALFAGDEAGMAGRMRTWPQDIRDHARALAAPAFPVI